MNEDPERFREMVWREGPVEVHRFLDRLDKTAAEYRRWSPALRAFAVECRRIVPPPDVELLTASEFAEYHILRNKMSQFAKSGDGLVTLAPRHHHLAVLSTNRVGLAAAEELFGGSSAVILEESERSRWFTQIYQAPSEGVWWYAFAWWTIRVAPGGNETKQIGRCDSTSLSDSYRIVESGMQWGPLAGGCRDELWRWDGAQVTFIETQRDVAF